MQFDQFRDKVAKQFAKMSQSDMLYRVDITGDELWEAYLSAFPEGTNDIYREREQHNCSCCRSFIRNLGNVIQIKQGKVHTIWEDFDVPTPYDVVTRALHKKVSKAPPVDLFLHYEKKVGTHHNYENETTRWDHFQAELSRDHVVPKANIASLTGDFRTSVKTFQRALKEISDYAIETVQELIGQGSLYRADQYKRSVAALKKTKAAYTKSKNKKLFCWESVNGTVASIRNTAIGTLLVDLSQSRDLDAAVSSYEEMVAPANYRRPTALITQTMINKAREEVESLGLTESLKRRYARPSDLTIGNVLWADRDAKKAMSSDAFDLLSPTKPAPVDKLSKIEEISIDKFLSDVLPQASTLELLVQNELKNNFVTLTTAEDASAPYLFAWKNSTAWCYEGEVTDSDIKQKVKSAGGAVDGDIRCSLAWFNTDDLDLHMKEPSYEIYFNNAKRLSPNKGVLDVDMNSGSGRLITTPVENIVYKDKAKMSPGTYHLKVHQFKKRNSSNVGFEVEIEILGKVHTFSYTKAVGQNKYVAVADIVVSETGEITLKPLLESSQVSKKIWNIDTQQFHRVSMVLNSPNYWDDRKVGTQHAFFILDSCKKEGTARGFFNEFLLPELNKHRKVFEVLGSKMKCEPADQQLSGLGFNFTKRSDFVVRVGGAFSRVLRVKV